MKLKSIVLSLTFLVACQQFDETSQTSQALYSTTGWTKVPDAGASYRNQEAVDGGAVGLHIETNAISNGARMAEITRDQVDLRAPGNAQNGPGVVGLVIGNRGSAQNPVWFDPGTVTMEGLSGWAKFMPFVIETPYVYVNGQGSIHTSNAKYASVVIPHTGMGSDGAASLDFVATIYTDGAPDINPSLSVDTSQPGEGSFSVYSGGDAIYSAGELVVCQAQGASCYTDYGSGSAAPTPGSGHGRITFDETSGSAGFIQSADGETHWHPLAGPIQYYHGEDPTSRSYSTGDTVVLSILPTATGYKGLKAWDPKRWTLPPMITIAGGNLVPKIKFLLNNGSSQTLSNATGSSVSHSRGDDFLAIVGAWIIEVDFIVTNTSGASSTQDVGLFQYEGSTN